MHNRHCPSWGQFAFCILHFALNFLILGLGMEHFSPIQIAPLQAHDKHFGGGQVGGDGHIVLVTMTDGLDHLGIVPGIDGIGIGEEQNQIDLIVGNAGIDLLMTALLMGKQQRQRQARIVGDQPTSGSSGIQIVLRQNVLVCSTELDHQFFLFVVCQKRDIH